MADRPTVAGLVRLLKPHLALIGRQGEDGDYRFLRALIQRYAGSDVDLAHSGARAVVHLLRLYTTLEDNALTWRIVDAVNADKPGLRSSLAPAPARPAEVLI